jgi:hypothetical protein
MSSIHHLFDSSGEWIAFRIGKNIYNPDADWIGWLPWNDTDVVTTNGDYLGTISNENRIYHFSNKPYRSYPGYPGFPGYPGYPRYPEFAGYLPLPSGAGDVKIPKPG